MQPRLRFLPISMFSIVLGLSGYSIATQRVFGGWAWGEGYPSAVLYATTVVYVALLVLYAAKLLRYRDAVAAEFRHPVMISFFPTLSISLLLLAIGYAEVSEPLSLVLWTVGAASNLVFTLVVLSIWIRHTHFEIAHFSPAWFIPVVGNLIVPVVGVQHAPADISWLFFAVGLVFAVVLLVIFFYRMVFHQPLHDRHLPTLFILIAPPAVAAVAYVKLTGSFDSFARILYYLAVFFALFLLVQVRMFARIRFYLSWWAYTFPMAALTIATFLVGKETASAFYKDAATVLWVGLTVLVAGLLVRTLVAVGRQEICVPDAAALGRASAADEPAAVEEPAPGEAPAEAPAEQALEVENAPAPAG